MSRGFFINSASSSGWRVSRGKSSNSRNATLFVFSYLSSPSSTQSGESQLETVVNASQLGSKRYGQGSNLTGGRIFIQFNPQPGILLPCLPTVSPVAKYTSVGETCSGPRQIQNRK